MHKKAALCFKTRPLVCIGFIYFFPANERSIQVFFYIFR